MEPLTLTPEYLGVHIPSLFAIGSTVHVAPDTSPMVRGRHSCGFVARVVGHRDGGYLVRDVLIGSGGRAIFMLADRVSKGCIGGMANVLARGKTAGSSVKRALLAGQASVEASAREHTAMRNEAPQAVSRL